VKIKAILDTNVFISGVFWKGPPFEILKAWQKQRFRLAISPPVLDEYRRVLDEMMKERPVPVLTSILRRERGCGSSERKALSRDWDRQARTIPHFIAAIGASNI